MLNDSQFLTNEDERFKTAIREWYETHPGEMLDTRNFSERQWSLHHDACVEMCPEFGALEAELFDFEEEESK